MHNSYIQRLAALFVGVIFFSFYSFPVEADPAFAPPAKTAAHPYTSLEPASVTYDTHEKGIGLLLGEPTGLTGKLFLDRDNAVDANLAYSFKSFLVVYGDYLWNMGSDFLEQNDFTKRLNFYFGAGGGFKFSTESADQRIADSSDQVEFFLRVPGGIEWRPVETPIGAFIEISPGLNVIPGLSLMLFANVGARYYF